MLRIAVIQRFLPSRSRGGVGHFTHGLCNTLQRRGHRVTVFSRDPAREDAAYGVCLLTSARSSAGSRWAPLSFPFQVARQDFSSFDLIHAQGDDHLISRRSPPIVRTMHGSALAEAIHNGWRHHSPKRFLMHLYFYGCELVATLRADAVIAVSKDTTRYYPRVHGVIPNGVDLDMFSPAQAAKSAQPTILFVGDLHSRKRGSLLLEVFQQIVKPTIPEAELWLVCPNRVEAAGVRWFGVVPPGRLARLYAQAWVFCLPSSYEGFGRPYIEAMAAGTPVVATSSPAAREVLGDGRCGVIVPNGRLGESLRALLTDRELRERLGRVGHDRAQAYSWDRVTERYERVYESVMNGMSASIGRGGRDLKEA